ncbi:unnamed protein product [Merluccius merluccius]
MIVDLATLHYSEPAKSGAEGDSYGPRPWLRASGRRELDIRSSSPPRNRLPLFSGRGTAESASDTTADSAAPPPPQLYRRDRRRRHCRSVGPRKIHIFSKVG